MRCLIGIDDTDNLESRGTGFRARQLGARLADAGLGRVRGITRHQLFVHPSIPYTSHNSSACLDVDIDGARLDAVREFCRGYLAQESADGSDAGLCLSAFDAVTDDLVAFGRSAKGTIRTQAEARNLAARHDAHLEGVTGDQMGVIGALSAVGLRRGGHDGRFIWLEGVRELAGTMIGRCADRHDWHRLCRIDRRPTASRGRDGARRSMAASGAAARQGGAAYGKERDGHEHGGWKILCKETIRRY